MVKKIYIEEDDYIFYVKTKKESFFKFLKLFPCNKGSVIYNIFKNMYNDIYGGGINFYKEYKKYYKKEYENFADFLHEHHFLTKDQIETLNNKNSFYKKKSYKSSSSYALLQNKTLESVENFIGGKMKDVL